METEIQLRIQQGTVIPASPLALDSQRRLDARRQRALWRYYSASGAGGIAIGVHTTQFAIRDTKIGLYAPLLQLAQEELNQLDQHRDKDLVRVAGVCGPTEQAVSEATLARETGFHLGLLSLGAMNNASPAELIAHCRAVGEVIPIFGFYLQPAVGGMLLPYTFWRMFLELDAVRAIKVAAFNRYQTIDVVRAVVDSGRDDIALYTGNDDNIVADLLTPYRFDVDGSSVEQGGRTANQRELPLGACCPAPVGRSNARRKTTSRGLVEQRFVGGLLGHWACWTSQAVKLFTECRAIVEASAAIPQEMLQRNIEVTDANAVLFDAANGFAGCIPGIHEVLHRQGLLEGNWCLDPREILSPGQAEELDRIYRAYPHLTDDAFVAEHRDEWLTE